MEVINKFRKFKLRGRPHVLRRGALGWRSPTSAGRNHPGVKQASFIIAARSEEVESLMCLRSEAWHSESGDLKLRGIDSALRSEQDFSSASIKLLRNLHSPNSVFLVSQPDNHC